MILTVNIHDNTVLGCTGTIIVFQFAGVVTHVVTCHILYDKGDILWVSTVHSSSFGLTFWIYNLAVTTPTNEINGYSLYEKSLQLSIYSIYDNIMYIICLCMSVCVRWESINQLTRIPKHPSANSVYLYIFHRPRKTLHIFFVVPYLYQNELTKVISQRTDIRKIAGSASKTILCFISALLCAKFTRRYVYIGVSFKAETRTATTTTEKKEPALYADERLVPP